MDKNVEILDKINKDSGMGMNSINYLLDKVEDENFRNVLNTEFNNYKEISDKVNGIYNKYAPMEKPETTNPMTKMMTWSGIQMNTMMDHSNSKISEIMIQGTNMGIISGRKVLNNSKLPNDIKDILNEFVTMQEHSVETLKKYL